MLPASIGGRKASGGERGRRAKMEPREDGRTDRQTVQGKQDGVEKAEHSAPELKRCIIQGNLMLLLLLNEQVTSSTHTHNMLIRTAAVTGRHADMALNAIPVAATSRALAPRGAEELPRSCSH